MTFTCAPISDGKKEKKIDCYKLRAVIEGRRNRLERHKMFQLIETNDAREGERKSISFHF